MVKMKVIVLHDNPDWFQPIREAFANYSVTVKEWVSDEFSVDLDQLLPADAIFYNRCSASAHTRGHPRSLDKMIEHVFGKSRPFLITPDRGGHGINIRFYNGVDEFEADAEPLDSIAGLFIIQEYITPRQGMYKSEFVRPSYLNRSMVRPRANGCLASNMYSCGLPSSPYRILIDYSQAALEKIGELFQGTRMENRAVEYIFDIEDEARVVDIKTTQVTTAMLRRWLALRTGGLKRFSMWS